MFPLYLLEKHVTELMDPAIVYLGIRCLIASRPAAFTFGRDTRHPLTRSLSGRQSWSGRPEEYKILLIQSGIKPRDFSVFYPIA